jgi:hypothetical protein
MVAERRRGVALIFIVVTLAVMLIMATVIVVNTASSSHQARVRAAANALIRFRSEFGAQGNAPSFIQDLNQAPGRLSHLYVQLTNQDRDSCGQVYGKQEINNWRGPYHLVPMLRDSNYQIEPGIISIDTLIRTPPNATGQQPGILSMVMRNVSLEMAQDLGMALDGIPSGTGPQITFTPNGSNPVTVFFNVPILGC